MRKTASGQIEESAIEARAGFLDRPVLAVLVISTALVILGLAVTWMLQ